MVPYTQAVGLVSCTLGLTGSAKRGEHSAVVWSTYRLPVTLGELTPFWARSALRLDRSDTPPYLFDFSFL